MVVPMYIKGESNKSVFLLAPWHQSAGPNENCLKRDSVGSDKYEHLSVVELFFFNQDYLLQHGDGTEMSRHFGLEIPTQSHIFIVLLSQC